MSSFKIKIKEIVLIKEALLDAEHNEKLNQFSKDGENDILKQKLTNNKNEFSKISNKENRIIRI